MSNEFSNLAGWATREEQAKSQRNVVGDKREACGRPFKTRCKSTGVVLEHTDTLSASKTLGLANGFISLVLNGHKNSSEYDMWYVPQPDLTYVHVSFQNGLLSLTIETERWANLGKSYWEPGGKYYKVLQRSTGKRTRTDISTTRPPTS